MNSVFFREILNGIAVTDENGNKLGHSTVSNLKVACIFKRVLQTEPHVVSLTQRKQQLKASPRWSSLGSPWLHQE